MGIRYLTALKYGECPVWASHGHCPAVTEQANPEGNARIAKTSLIFQGRYDIVSKRWVNSKKGSEPFPS